MLCGCSFSERHLHSGVHGALSNIEITQKEAAAVFVEQNSQLPLGETDDKSHTYTVVLPGEKKKNLKLGGNVDRSSGIYKEGTRVYQNPVVTTPGTWVHSDH